MKNKNRKIAVFLCALAATATVALLPSCSSSPAPSAENAVTTKEQSVLPSATAPSEPYVSVSVSAPSESVGVPTKIPVSTRPMGTQAPSSNAPSTRPSVSTGSGLAVVPGGEGDGLDINDLLPPASTAMPTRPVSVAPSVSDAPASTAPASVPASVVPTGTAASTAKPSASTSAASTAAPSSTLRPQATLPQTTTPALPTGQDSSEGWSPLVPL